MPLPGNVTQVRVGELDLVDSNGVLLTGKTLKVTPTEERFADGSANAVVYSVPATAVVDGAGAAWVTVPATDNTVLDSTFSLAVLEPDGKTAYFIQAPSTAPVETIDGVSLPTVHLSTASHAPAPATGVVQLSLGPPGLSLIVLHRAPTSADGVDGQGYVDTLNAKVYGPKTAGAWGTGTNIGTGGGAGTVTQVAGVNPDGSGHVALTAANVSAVATSTLGANGGTATLDAGGDVPLSQLGNAPGGGGAVASVNGQVGVVVLTAANVSAIGTGDARLSDARTPTAHHASHEPGGSDALVNYPTAAVVTGGWKISFGSGKTLWLTSTDPGGAAANGDNWINNA